MPSLFTACGPLLRDGTRAAAAGYANRLAELMIGLPQPAGIVAVTVQPGCGLLRIGAGVSGETTGREGALLVTVHRLLTERGIACLSEGACPVPPELGAMLRLLAPRDTPVVVIAADAQLAGCAYYRLGLALAPLRGRDVLIVGGAPAAPVHGTDAAEAAAYGSTAARLAGAALPTGGWLREQLAGWRLQALFDGCRPVCADTDRSADPLASAGSVHDADPHACADSVRGTDTLASAGSTSSSASPAFPGFTPAGVFLPPLLFAMGAADDARTATRHGPEREETEEAAEPACWTFG